MSVGRGIQSVIFYYLSCAPCTKAANRRNRKRQASLDRKDREAILAGLPDTYRQPSPFRTNDHWAAEIRAGPGPPERNIKKKERERRRREGEKDVERGRTTRKPDEEDELDEKQMIKMPEPAHLAGLRSILKNTEHRLSGLERWRLFQREDEELWGNESVESLEHPHPARFHSTRHSVGGSSVGVPGPFNLHHRRKEGYWTARNPPVNDLHPPVVSVPTKSRASNHWMLQPPPPSAVMNGYSSASRGRSDSDNSKLRSTPKGNSSKKVRLDRDIGVRLIESDGITGSDDSMPSIYPTVSRSSNLDGTVDGTPLQKHSDSGVELTGSSNNSRCSTSQEGQGIGTFRQDFAVPNRPATAASPYTFISPPTTTTRTASKPAPARRKPVNKAAPPGKIMTTTAIFSKKASRVAMPLPKSTSIRQDPPSRINKAVDKSTARPRLSRVFSNPNPNPPGLVSQDRTLQHAQLDGAEDAHVNVEAEADQAEDDELIDPLDASHSPQRTTRRRGVTEAGPRRPVGKGLPTWDFERVRGADDVFVADEVEEEEDVRQADIMERQTHWQEEHSWIAHPALLPIMPKMDGRRWSFDL